MAPLSGMPEQADACADAPQVSIIVPIYNVAPYLSRCLDSLVAQTLASLEILLVDDGSTDASGAMADWYARQHPHMRVIHQANRGLGEARNAGLAICRGSFVAFVDSDDYVVPTYAECLLTAIRRAQADIAVCSYTTISRRGLHIRSVLPWLLPPTLTGSRAMRLTLRDTAIKNYAWNKLFRRTLFTDRDIRFPAIRFEDIAIMPLLFSRARRVSIVKEPLYFYCRRAGSLLAIYTPQRIEDTLQALTMVRDDLQTYGLYRRYRHAYWYLVHKFGVYLWADTMVLHWKDHLPNAFPAAWRSFRRAGALYRLPAARAPEPALAGMDGASKEG